MTVNYETVSTHSSNKFQRKQWSTRGITLFSRIVLCLERVFDARDESDMDEEIEKPLTSMLYRQSSYETRLSPLHLSDESVNNSDEDGKQSPKIIDLKLKNEAHPLDFKSNTPPPSRKDSSEYTLDFENKQIFMKNLQSALEKKLGNNNINTNQKSEQKNTEKYVTPKSLKQNVQNPRVKKTHKNICFRQKDIDEKTGKNDSQDVIEMKNLHDIREKSSRRKIEDAAEKLDVKQMTNVYGEGITHLPSEYNQTGAPLTTSQVKKNRDVEPMSDKIDVGALNVSKVKKRDSKFQTLPSKSEKEDQRVKGESFKTKRNNMATIRPKSPRQGGTLKNDKEETFWDKIGTIGRKKRIKEVQEVEAVEAEGKYAIDSTTIPPQPDIPPEDYELGDNEERTMVDPKACEDLKFLELTQVLIEWINDELASQRIIVQDLAEDLYDGQVLQKLLEKLTGDKLDVPEVTQSEEGQKQKLAVVLAHFNKVLGIPRPSHNKWNVEAIHSKNVVPIMHLLVALARHFRPPVRLPEHVSVRVVVVQKSGGHLIHKTVREKITAAYDDVGMRCERDAFDTLFDHAPDKLKVVKKSLVTFVNKHLNKINLEVTEIESQFHDGVYLIMLMGLLEGFFVPLYSFYPTAKDFDQKVHNVSFAFELMEEVGLQRPKARPEDVVNMDLKSTLRVLYNLFLKYKNIM